MTLRHRPTCSLVLSEAGGRQRTRPRGAAQRPIGPGGPGHPHGGSRVHRGNRGNGLRGNRHGGGGGGSRSERTPRPIGEGEGGASTEAVRQRVSEHQPETVFMCIYLRSRDDNNNPLKPSCAAEPMSRDTRLVLECVLCVSVMN